MPIEKSSQLNVPSEQLEAYCRRWKIKRMWLLEVTARGEPYESSDVDAIVEFATDEQWSFGYLIAADIEFSELIGRTVDLIERHTIERGANWTEHRRILESVSPIYVA